MSEGTNELRRTIAEATGYTLTKADKRWYDSDVWHVNHNGKCLGHTMGDNVDQAWRNAFDHVYETNGGVAREGIPDWPNDPGAALVLCLEITEQRDWHVTMSQYAGDVYVRFYMPRKEGYEFAARGVTPAEALARLALSALEAQGT